MLERLGLGQAGYTSNKDSVRRAPLPSTLYQVNKKVAFLKLRYEGFLSTHAFNLEGWSEQADSRSEHEPSRSSRNCLRTGWWVTESLFSIGYLLCVVSIGANSCARFRRSTRCAIHSWCQHYSWAEQLQLSREFKNILKTPICICTSFKHKLSRYWGFRSVNSSLKSFPQPILSLALRSTEFSPKIPQRIWRRTCSGLKENVEINFILECQSNSSSCRECRCCSNDGQMVYGDQFTACCQRGMHRSSL